LHYYTFCYFVSFRQDRLTTLATWWLGGSAVRVLDTRLKGPQFNFQPVHYQVATLGNLFTPMCLCRCKWSSGYYRLFQVMVRFSLPVIWKQRWASC